MFAIIQTGGKQYQVQKDDVLNIEKIPVTKSKEVTFKDVLLCADKKQCTVGHPYVKGVKVVADVVDEFRSAKLRTHKYKRRKSYHRTIGHRQDLVKIRIKEIIFKKES